MRQTLELSKEAVNAIENGKLIEAIKITRANTGLGLKESKDAVEAFINANPVIQERVQAKRATSGISREIVIMIVIAIGLAFVYVNFFKT